eukprot:11443310-Alexandrium_andersonii.AAC.1
MSASLVGSEMCIRDRHQKQHRQEAQGGKPTPPEKISDHAGDEGPIARRCLLYTSDAADDM